MRRGEPIPRIRVGYACIPLGSAALRGPRTTVLRRATAARLRELIAGNIGGLAETLCYNARQGFTLFRISTQFIPFGSHPVNQVPWWEEFAGELHAVGDLARRQGQRLSFHVSNYAVLNSLRQPVVDAALAEIEYQSRALDAMGLDASHRVVAHVGVRRPTPAEARGRFCCAVARLSEGARRRLAIENDEFYWSADAVVALARDLGLPAVFDILHHRVCGGDWRARPTEEILTEVFATWGATGGPPKVHFSSQDPDKRAGAHGEYVNAAELDEFLARASALGRPFDVMFEAKAKDLAVLRAAPALARYGVRVGAGVPAAPV
ncbi:MAG: UV DNA damage repair endonuclease UvsE [Armatimonadetes bacterium]|nr:UV DNA damage repair endonuclease UvsE [Armatimonadota bacterium]